MFTNTKPPTQAKILAEVDYVCCIAWRPNIAFPILYLSPFHTGFVCKNLKPRPSIKYQYVHMYKNICMLSEGHDVIRVVADNIVDCAGNRF